MTNHAKLKAWVDEVAKLCKPNDVYWCDGSQSEYDAMAQKLVEAGSFIKLNEQKRPNSYLCWSDPADVARVEDRTYICCEKEEDAGDDNTRKGAGHFPDGSWTRRGDDERDNAQRERDDGAGFTHHAPDRGIVNGVILHDERHPPSEESLANGRG